MHALWALTMAPDGTPHFRSITSVSIEKCTHSNGHENTIEKLMAIEKRFRYFNAHEKLSLWALYIEKYLACFKVMAISLFLKLMAFITGSQKHMAMFFPLI